MIRASVISFYCVVNNIISSSFIIIVHVKTSIQRCTLLYTYCHCLVCLCMCGCCTVLSLFSRVARQDIVPLPLCIEAC